MLLNSLLFLGGVSSVVAKVQFMGMNIPGFEFGCAIDGTCPTSSVQAPLSTLNGADGLGQMQHFVKDDQMNVFRLPVSWQFLVANKLGGKLDTTNFAKYDDLMQSCLSTGTYCAIDLHNFARFNGQIIGQSSGAVTDAQFADLWSQLATKYKSNTKVIFGLMNEPHDLDVPTWAASVQAAVTAIRNTGATSQMILLPGTNFASAGQFVSSGSAAELIKITNPDSTTTNLILDLHKYLDVDNSGTHAECTTDNIADAFQIAADFLRTNKRQALVSETGAGSTASCFTAFCAQNTFLNQNSDVFLGYIAWGAGSFSTSYILSLTPSKQNGVFVDNKLASQCVVAPWLNAASVLSSTVASSTQASVVSSSAVVSGPGGISSAGVSSTVEVSTKNSNGGNSVSSTLATTASIAIGTGSAIASPRTSGIPVGTGAIPSSTSNYTATQTGAPSSTTSQLASKAGPGMRRFAGSLMLGSFLVVAIL